MISSGNVLVLQVPRVAFGIDFRLSERADFGADRFQRLDRAWSRRRSRRFSVIDQDHGGGGAGALRSCCRTMTRSDRVCSGFWRSVRGAMPKSAGLDHSWPGSYRDAAEDLPRHISAGADAGSAGFLAFAEALFAP